MSRPIYFDYAATTPIDSEVCEAMMECLNSQDAFGNPSSQTHAYGIAAHERIEQARQQFAETIGTASASLVFTSGATESNNLAILGAARFYGRRRRHLITMTTEHRSVLACFETLAREGFEVTYLSPEPDGLLDTEKLKAAMRRDTLLVSVMHVNNEIGVIQPIALIGEIVQSHGALFHVDAAQSAGKLPINLATLPVDLMSFSAHKNYGPQGIGALYVRHHGKRVRLSPILYGGGQEGGLRSGTLPTHQIIGMGKAFDISSQCLASEQARIMHFRNFLWAGIVDIPQIQLNGHPTMRIAGNLNITFHGVDEKKLKNALQALAVSSAAACGSSKYQHSHVLKALGLDDTLAARTIRLTLGRYTTAPEIEKAITVIRSVF